MDGMNRVVAKWCVCVALTLVALAGALLSGTQVSLLARTGSPVKAPGSTRESHYRSGVRTSNLAGIAIDIDEIVASGFEHPVHVTHAGDGSGRLFVVEQAGRIQITQNGATRLFLDISDRVRCCVERGLFSVAFPPDYAAKGHFYVNYTRKPDGATVVARYQVTVDPDRADPGSEEVVLLISQPFGNHNGGQLAFGPVDGYLYVGMGDGGSGGDPLKQAQDPATLLGKMLRIDVETGDPSTYVVPPSNPYTQTVGYLDEIWALGVRNPWRFSFDRDTGDLYIGDVGQNAWEEIDFLPVGTQGGVNLGWRCREGTHTFNTDPPCDDPALLATLLDPVAEYSHGTGRRSVTGGFVYRGADYAALVGWYFYADYIEGKIWSINTHTWSAPELELDTSLGISSFGEDEQGEVYVADYWGGTIRRLAHADGPTLIPIIRK
jgi:glucose/arabinose dehydrogenase